MLYLVQVRMQDLAGRPGWSTITDHEDVIDPGPGEHRKRQRAAAYECEDCAESYAVQMRRRFPDATYRVVPLVFPLDVYDTDD